jgi:hypothetical protein
LYSSGLWHHTELWLDTDISEAPNPLLFLGCFYLPPSQFLHCFLSRHSYDFSPDLYQFICTCDGPFQSQTVIFNLAPIDSLWTPYRKWSCSHFFSWSSFLAHIRPSFLCELHLASCLLLVWLTFWLWRWRQEVPLKSQWAFTELHNLTIQKIIHCIATTVRTSNQN